MTKALDLDLKKLNARAFDRAEWAEEVLCRYHASILNLDDGDDETLERKYAARVVAKGGCCAKVFL